MSNSARSFLFAFAPPQHMLHPQSSLLHYKKTSKKIASMIHMTVSLIPKSYFNLFPITFLLITLSSLNQLLILVVKEICGVAVILQVDLSLTGDACNNVVDAIKEEIAGELWEWLVSQPTHSFSKLSDDNSTCFDLRPGDHFNVLLATQDTPVEILHTWLLGNEKYWHKTSKAWPKDSDKEELFAVRLQTSWTDGLSTPPIHAAYLIQYKNNLIGKHFKIMQQVEVFHLHRLCPLALFDLWKAFGELGAMIWYTEIHDINIYLADLQIFINNLLDAWAVVDPQRIVTKVKLHVLTHLVDDIQHFRIAVAFSTEVFECFNAVFHYCSILSNHLAPSCDIAISTAGMEQFKHIVSGGYWKDEVTNKHMQAGAKVSIFLKNNPELQCHLEWVDKEVLQAGYIKLMLHKKRQSSPWPTIAPIIGIDEHDPQAWVISSKGASIQWEHCSLVVSCFKDLCHKESWIFYLDSTGTNAGKIKAILIPESDTRDSAAMIIVTKFDILNERDMHFGMPVLVQTTQLHFVSPSNILFTFNAQHDCVTGGCEMKTSMRLVIQEQLKTNTYQKEIAHADNNQFLLNMHALHNSHLILHHLVAPVPLRNDQKEFHLARATEAHRLGLAKWAEASAKHTATIEKNKQVKLAAVEASKPLDKE
uniref:Uncharacterized protein n=1 Tax=Moniliophthora roreri TaxID=221103 RepID=A0A0W0EVR0_MONRR